MYPRRYACCSKSRSHVRAETSPAPAGESLSCELSVVGGTVQLSLSPEGDQFLNTLSLLTPPRRRLWGLAQVRFDSVEAEVNFVALLTLVGVGGGYRALLHSHTGEGAHGVATRALLGAYLAVSHPPAPPPSCLPTCSNTLLLDCSRR